MSPHEPLNPEDLVIDPGEALRMGDYEFSEEELAELDRRDAEALRDLATNRSIALEDALAELNAPQSTRLAG